MGIRVDHDMGGRRPAHAGDRPASVRVRAYSAGLVAALASAVVAVGLGMLVRTGSGVHVAGAVLLGGLSATLAVDVRVTRRLARLARDVTDDQAVHAGSVPPAADQLDALDAHVVGLRRELADTTDELTRRGLELGRALDFRDDLVATISHEVRTPLTVVLGLSELITARAAALTSAEVVTFSRRIHAHGRRLERLVVDLLDASTGDTVVPRPRPVALDPLARVVVADLGLDHEVTVRGDTRAVGLVDGHHVRRILGALLDNATKYGHAPFTVDLEGDADQVVLAVQDSGPGVPETFEDELFDAFSQSDRGDRRTATGIGLGLHVARMLAQANGGVLQHVHSDTGARFEVRLPRARVDDGTARLVHELDARAEVGSGPQWPRDQEAFDFLDALPDPVLVHEGGVVAYVNDAFLRTLGMTSPAEVVGRPATSMVADPAALADALEGFARQAPHGTPHAADVPVRHADGHELMLSVTRTETVIGHTPCTVIVARDVTQQRRWGDRMQVLLSAMSATHTSRSEQVQHVLALATDALGLDIGGLGRVEDGRLVIERIHAPDGGLAPGHTVAMEDMLCSVAWRVDGVVAIADVQVSELHTHAAHRRFGVSAYIGTRVYVGGRPYGTLGFSSLRPRLVPWDDQDRRLVELVAQWVGSVLTVDPSLSRASGSRGR